MTDASSLAMFYLLFAPALAAAGCWLIHRTRTLGLFNFAVSVTLFVAGLVLAGPVLRAEQTTVIGTLFRTDALSAYFALVVTFIYLFVSWYNISFMEVEEKDRSYSKKRLKTYYSLLLLFTGSMLLVVLCDNLGLMWVALEATTLVSGVLVAISGTREAIGAAWKYLILCTVGIALGLFGTVMTYFAAVRELGENSLALNWSYLIGIADQLDPQIMQIAFAFILVGYGTKAGIAPLHSWLPDAHSQAPAPVSAMLSGVLLSCALYGIIRFNALADAALPSGRNDQMLIALGVVSVVLATLFLLTQVEYKRVLAYSSIEHMGVILIGVGIGTKLALFGALLHVLTHAISKSLLFLTAGSIYQSVRSHLVSDVRGLLRADPVLGTTVLVGSFAIAGSPPFGTFVSEFAVVYGAFKGGYLAVGALIVSAVIVVFAAFLKGAQSMAFGEPESVDGPESASASADLAHQENIQDLSTGRPLRPLFLIMIFLTFAIGPVLPGPLSELVIRAAQLAGGGN